MINLRYLSFVFFILFVYFAFSSSGIVDLDDNFILLNASASDKVYVDALGGNPDVALLLCDQGSKYVGAVYYANKSGTPVYILISRDLQDTQKALVNTSISYNSTCKKTPLDRFAFSQFSVSTTPKVFVSAFPGIVSILFSDSVDGSNPGFVSIDPSHGWLRGSYSGSCSFSPSTSTVSLDVSSITFRTAIGDITKSPSDPDWGLSESKGRSFLVSLCNDSVGLDCMDAQIINKSPQLPASLSFVGTLDDQHVYNLHGLVNGIELCSLCIGPDITLSISISPNPIYYGDSSNIVVTIRNSGNVGITSDFPVNLTISGPGGFSDSRNWLITENLDPGDETTRSFVFSSYPSSGIYTFHAVADNTDEVKECAEGASTSASLSVLKTYVLNFTIDGNESLSFPRAGVAYNISIHISDSEGNDVPAYIEMEEFNGLTPFIPLQFWNNSGTEYNISSKIFSSFRTNSSGWIKLTIIPSCNKLYDPALPYHSTWDVDNRFGEYKILFRARHPSGGSWYTFSIGGNLVSEVELNITNSTCPSFGWVNNKTLPNQKTFVEPILDWLYETFAIAKKLFNSWG